MSYCRWSSDNFRSDVYVYCSVDGYVTHIANNRLVGPRIGAPPYSLMERGKVGMFIWGAWHRVNDFLFKFLIRKSINHTLAGETYISDTAYECADVLMTLREKGFSVPQHAIDRLLEESREDEQ